MTFPPHLSYNPILARELRLQMRDARAYWMLFGYVGTLSLVFLWSYAFWWSEAQSGGVRHSPEPGGSLFVSIISAQILLVLCITPSLAAGALTRVSARGVREMLTRTRLSPLALVSGKLFAAFLFVGLLLSASLPFAGLCWLLGGAAITQMLNAYICLLAGSFLLCALGLLWSSLSRATTPAVLWTYLTASAAFAPLYEITRRHQRGFCVFCILGGLCLMILASVCTKRRFKR